MVAGYWARFEAEGTGLMHWEGGGRWRWGVIDEQ